VEAVIFDMDGVVVDTDVPVEECLKGTHEIREQRIREVGYEPIEGTLDLIREIHG